MRFVSLQMIKVLLNYAIHHITSNHDVGYSLKYIISFIFCNEYKIIVICNLLFPELTYFPVTYVYTMYGRLKTNI